MPAEERAPEPINPDVGIERPNLEVTARPVDTMVESGAGKQLAQLAKSFSDVSPELGKLSDALLNKEKEKAQMQGETAATEAHQKMIDQKQSYADMVKSGTISSIENPWARLYARETFGRLAAGDYMSWLEAQPDVARVLNSSTDPGAFLSLEKQMRSKYQQEKFGDTHSDLAFTSAFDKMTQGYVQDKNMQYAHEVQTRFVGEQANHLLSEFAQHIGESLDTHQSAATIQKDLQSLSDGAVQNGVHPIVTRAAMAKAIDQLARTRGDESIYDLAKTLKIDGDEVYYSEDMGKLRDTGVEDILRRKRQQLLVDRDTAIEKRKEGEQDIYDKMTTAQLASDKPIDLSPFQKMMNDQGYTPDVAKLTNIQAQLLKKNNASNPEQVRDFTARIYGTTDPSSMNYVSRASLVEALSGGSINAQDFNTLYNEVKNRDKLNKSRGGSDKAGLTPASIIEQGRSLLRSDFPVDAAVWNVAKSKATTAAWAEYNSTVTGFMESNPQATAEQVQKFVYDTITQLTDRYGPIVNPAGTAVAGTIPQPTLRSKPNKPGEKAPEPALSPEDQKTLAREYHALRTGQASPDVLKDLDKRGLLVHGDINKTKDNIAALMAKAQSTQP